MHSYTSLRPSDALMCVTETRDALLRVTIRNLCTRPSHQINLMHSYTSVVGACTLTLQPNHLLRSFTSAPVVDTSRLCTLHCSGLSLELGLYVSMAVILSMTAFESRSDVASTTTISLSVRFMQSSNGVSGVGSSSLVARFVSTPVETMSGFGWWHLLLAAVGLLLTAAASSASPAHAHRELKNARKPIYTAMVIYMYEYI